MSHSTPKTPSSIVVDNAIAKLWDFYYVDRSTRVSCQPKANLEPPLNLQKTTFHSFTRQRLHHETRHTSPYTRRHTDTMTIQINTDVIMLTKKGMCRRIFLSVSPKDVGGRVRGKERERGGIGVCVCLFSLSYNLFALSICRAYMGVHVNVLSCVHV